MQQPFGEAVSKAARRHAEREWPKEACGVVIQEGEGFAYLEQENQHPDPAFAFRLPLEAPEHVAVVHSHIDNPHASRADMEAQERGGVPWGIVPLDKQGNAGQPFWWGDSLPIAPLVGRPFVYGVYDCWTLIRDWHRMWGRTLPVFPRDYPDGAEMYQLWPQYADEITWDDLQPGDWFAISVASSNDRINHAGLYVGDGLMLHHMIGRLSRREPVGRWRKTIQHVLRFKEEATS